MWRSVANVRPRNIVCTNVQLSIELVGNDVSNSESRARVNVCVEANVCICVYVRQCVCIATLMFMPNSDRTDGIKKVHIEKSGEAKSR